MDFLWTQLGSNGWGAFGSLVLLVLLAFFLGRVIPKSTHERELNLWKDLAEQRQQEAAEWKTTYQAEHEITAQLAPQLDIVAKFFAEVEVDPKTGDTDHGYRLEITADQTEGNR